MAPHHTEKPTSSLRGRSQLWVAVACIGLSNLLSAVWVWSLIQSHPH